MSLFLSVGTLREAQSHRRVLDPRRSAVELSVNCKRGKLVPPRGDPAVKRVVSGS